MSLYILLQRVQISPLRKLSHNYETFILHKHKASQSHHPSLREDTNDNDKAYVRRQQMVGNNNQRVRNS